uniref:Uncharacterized protein n=1 Tax=Megaselia scalaris TaxID=36166 RepID=T1GUS2_MEGSC
MKRLRCAEPTPPRGTILKRNQLISAKFVCTRLGGLYKYSAKPENMESNNLDNITPGGTHSGLLTVDIVVDALKLVQAWQHSQNTPERSRPTQNRV